ncbi:short-chain dehydrogenase [Aspergillus californicus]
MTSSILITGGTTGVGYYCTIALAKKFPTHNIIIASRTDSNDAAGTINRLLGQKNVRHMYLDLSKMSQIRTFVQQWVDKTYPPIEYLLLNAGLQFPGPVELSEDGFEKTFAITNIGNPLLFSLLMPHLAHTARVVVTGSGTHDPAQKWGMPEAEYTTAEELAHPTAKTLNHPGRKRYTSSRLAVLMWTYALDRRLKTLRDTNQRNWTVATFDPGLMPGTALVRASTSSVETIVWYHVLPHVLPLLRLLMGKSNIQKPGTSGESLAWLASDVEVSKFSGRYYEERRAISSSEDSYDEVKQEELWEWTLKTIASGPEELALFSLKGFST